MGAAKISNLRVRTDQVERICLNEKNGSATIYLTNNNSMLSDFGPGKIIVEKDDLDTVTQDLWGMTASKRFENGDVKVVNFQTGTKQNLMSPSTIRRAKFCIKKISLGKFGAARSCFPKLHIFGALSKMGSTYAAYTQSSEYTPIAPKKSLNKCSGYKQKGMTIEYK